MTSDRARRIAGSRRQIHVSPSHGSRMMSSRQHSAIGLPDPCLVALGERSGVDRGGLALDDRVKLQLRQRLANRPETVLGNAELEVFVVASLPAAEEVERPACYDRPRHVHIRETPGSLRGMPGVPLGNVGVERLPRFRLVALRSSDASGTRRAERSSRSRSGRPRRSGPRRHRRTSTRSSGRRSRR